jgi:hypothetical protein
MDRRKELTRAYKENPPRAGVLQVRNTVNGKIYIVAYHNVDGKINSQRFQLAGGGHANKGLQDDWKAQKPGDFVFEVLEYLTPPSEDASALIIREALSALEKRWLDKLKPWGERGYNKPPAAG